MYEKEVSSFQELRYLQEFLVLNLDQVAKVHWNYILIEVGNLASEYTMHQQK